ncbi:MAG: metallophosphoesterase [Lachnospiraceae bacterium]|nr:metallophosphoesterase [Lachnospiraceae bacterium]
MSLYVIGDPHLSLGVDKPMDIFQGWGNYVDKLKENWLQAISDDDTIVVAGDISWGMSMKEALPDFKFIDGLPGKKIFLKGNHDYWWETKTKSERFFTENGISTISILFNNAYEVEGKIVCGTRGWFYDAHDAQDVKVLNREVGRLRLSLNAAANLKGEPIVFLHYPPVFAGKECSEIFDVLLEYGIKKCYYGHLHGKRAASLAMVGGYKGVELKLISCDNTQFKPIRVV